MVFAAAGGDDDLIGELGPVRCGGKGAGRVVPGVARRLEEADGGLEGGVKPLLVGHIGGIDRVAVDVDRISLFIAVVGRLRGGPSGSC